MMEEQEQKVNLKSNDAKKNESNKIKKFYYPIKKEDTYYLNKDNYLTNKTNDDNYSSITYYLTTVINIGLANLSKKQDFEYYKKRFFIFYDYTVLILAYYSDNIIADNIYTELNKIIENNLYKDFIFNDNERDFDTKISIVYLDFFNKCNIF